MRNVEGPDLGSISIHALREEGDAALAPPVRAAVISIHALREEGDLTRRKRFGQLDDFYPRPPRGGRPPSPIKKSSAIAFLSTPSARRATLTQYYEKSPSDISIHALREEGDAVKTHQGAGRRTFLSTPSARRATHPLHNSIMDGLFLSTPSARRATLVRGRQRRGKLISIHALREEGDPPTPQ